MFALPILNLTNVIYIYYYTIHSVETQNTTGQQSRGVVRQYWDMIRGKFGTFSVNWDIAHIAKLNLNNVIYIYYYTIHSIVT